MTRYFDAPSYLRIAPRITAVSRLAALRHLAAQGSGNWRTARAWTLDNWEGAYSTLSQGFNTKEVYRFGNATTTRTPVWYCHTGEQFRDERNVSDIDGAGVDHNGWFADEDCSRTIYGIVARLSRGRFIAGTCSSDSGERVYFAKVFDDERTAAQWADSEAKSAADDEREHDERYQAAQEINDEIMHACKEAARLYALRNHPVLGEEARDELRAALETIREKRDELKTEYKDIEF